MNHALWAITGTHAMERAQHVIVVHGNDGADEVSLTSETSVVEWDGQKLEAYNIKPEDYGLKRCSLGELVCETADHAFKSAEAVLRGAKGPKTDFVVFNAAFALRAGDICSDIRKGIDLIHNKLQRGEVMKKIREIKLCGEQC